MLATLAGDAQVVVCDATKLGHWLDVPLWLYVPSNHRACVGKQKQHLECMLGPLCENLGKRDELHGFGQLVLFKRAGWVGPGCPSPCLLSVLVR